MAVLKSQFLFTGSLGELSFYTVTGSDKIIVRRKGGPSKKQILTGENFEHTRLNCKEFAGRVLGSQQMLRALWPMRGIFNYNAALAFHKPLKAIQEFDALSRKGERNIRFSQKPVFLEGFGFNNRSSLESVIRTPLECEISREGRAVVHIPELVPGVNLMLAEKYPYYRIVVALATVPDLHSENGRYASPIADLQLAACNDKATPWTSVRASSAASTVEVNGERPSGNDFAWVLSVGLQLGVPSKFDSITPVRKQGTGKILKAVSGTGYGDSPANEVRPGVANVAD